VELFNINTLGVRNMAIDEMSHSAPIEYQEATPPLDETSDAEGLTASVASESSEQIPECESHQKVPAVPLSKDQASALLDKIKQCCNDLDQEVSSKTDELYRLIKDFQQRGGPKCLVEINISWNHGFGQ
jgi:hypothetical protein